MGAVFTDPELYELIRMGGKGLENAFRHLMEEERRGRYIKNMVIQTGGTIEDFEEVFNDALIGLHSSVLKGNFRQESSIAAYLKGIARNLWYKKRGKMKSGFEVDPNPYEHESPVEVEIIKGEKRRLLLEIVNQLSQSCRDILLKAFFEGMKNQELVAILGYKNEGVVRKKKSLCLKSLMNYIHGRPALKELL